MVYRNFMFTATLALLAVMTPVDALPIMKGGRSTSPLAEVSSEAGVERNGGRSTNPMAEVESKTTANTQAKVGAKSQASSKANADRDLNMMTWFKDIKNPMSSLDDRPA